jgi:hypothetical protein
MTIQINLPPLTFGSFEGSKLGNPSYSKKENSFQAAIWYPLPSSVEKRITSDPLKKEVRTWKDFGPPKSEFAYLQVTHLNMKGKETIGELVIHKDLAREVVDISHEIFSSHFPIEQERLMDYWDADDDRSMSANNSSALCVRWSGGKVGTLSKHALGRAWDLNPKINPFYHPELKIISPEEGKDFLDRSREVPGMIREGDRVVKIFDAHGWEWGGRWEKCFDYQHFEKPVKKPPVMQFLMSNVKKFFGCFIGCCFRSSKRSLTKESGHLS